ncbi:MAG: NAD-dependent epimerase/dehydratase family protein [Anaerolineae bacterium]|nr:NAD-dependent epimerase/dehydratase family protein [Anaerolineae bacterium]
MKLSNKSILLTGGAGFIGSHVAAALVRIGANVTVVDNLSTGQAANLHPVAAQVAFHPLDIRTPSFIDFVIDGRFDVIVHLAANAYIPPAVENPDYDYHVNLHAPFRLFDALRRSKQRPVILVSSSAAVYGNPAHYPVAEDAPTLPVSPYGVSKLGMERYLAVYSQLYEFRAASMRLFSVYGPRQRKQIVYDLIAKLCDNPHRLQILGDGTQIRDLIYVEDVARAAICILANAPLRGEVYNVAGGVGSSTRQVAEAICRAMRLTPEFAFTGSIRPGDSEKWVADIGRLRSLGFSPGVALDEGICRTVAWYYLAHHIDQNEPRQVLPHFQ